MELMTRLALLITVVSAVCWPIPVVASSGAQNLVIYPGMLQELRAVHTPTAREQKVEVGPLLGYSCHADPAPSHHVTCETYHVYYARYRGKEYAAADFWNTYTGSTDSTEKFERAVGGRWRDIGDGWPPECGFPASVVKMLGLAALPMKDCVTP